MFCKIQPVIGVEAFFIFEGLGCEVVSPLKTYSEGGNPYLILGQGVRILGFLFTLSTLLEIAWDLSTFHRNSLYHTKCLQITLTNVFGKKDKRHIFVGICL